MHVPNRLRALREQSGLTIKQLAYAIGRDSSTVSRWETGGHGIPDQYKVRVADILGVTVGDLICWGTALDDDTSELTAA